MNETWEILPEPLSPGPSNYVNICPCIMLIKSHLKVDRLFSLLLFSKDIYKDPTAVMVRKFLLVFRLFIQCHLLLCQHFLLI